MATTNGGREEEKTRVLTKTARKQKCELAENTGNGSDSSV
jgi:hypothetical protein